MNISLECFYILHSHEFNHNAKVSIRFVLAFLKVCKAVREVKRGQKEELEHAVTRKMSGSEEIITSGFDVLPKEVFDLVEPSKASAALRFRADTAENGEK